MRAVISEPERDAASITTSPSESSATTRLQLEKCLAMGAVPIGTSASMRHFLAISFCNFFILRRVGNINPTGDRGNRFADCHGSLMRRSVNSRRKAGYHNQFLLSQISGKLLYHPHPIGGSVSPPHQPDAQRGEERNITQHR